jgi:hypothetical protein
MALVDRMRAKPRPRAGGPPRSRVFEAAPHGTGLASKDGCGLEILQRLGYGTSTSLPVLRRVSRSSWARRASASA